MKKIIIKSFGGISKKYYVRNFLFGLIFPAFMIIAQPPSINLPLTFYVIFAINTLLYPYSRFVYESIFNYLIGENNFFVDAKAMLIVKAITMLLCWGFSLLIAPIGLFYLYYYNNKIANKEINTDQKPVA